MVLSLSKHLYSLEYSILVLHSKQLLRFVSFTLKFCNVYLSTV